MILRVLAERLGCALRGDGEVEVARVAPIDEAEPGSITFVASPKWAPRLKSTRASAVIVAPTIETPLPSLLSDNPYLTFARAVAVLHPQPAPPPGVDPKAVVHATAVLGEGVHVGPLAVVGARTRIGARSVVHPQVVLYEDVLVGEDCVLHSGVQVRERCRIGNRVVVQNGAVIGGDGFGFAPDSERRYHKIPQIGIVVIEDDVEIGALSAIDRAALGETRIGRGSKLDNLVQIGHSVTVGRDTVVAGQVGIAGSTVIGDRVVLAGQVGIVGHIKIADGAIATAQTGIGGDVEAGAVVSGSPAIPNREWLKATAAFSRLPEILRRLRALEKHQGGGDST